ncbi:MAG: glutamine amidotransferase [Elusimicrobia bacterium]|nr:glutamine amidotransferase [Elusimicrobiota bacterium]
MTGWGLESGAGVWSWAAAAALAAAFRLHAARSPARRPLLILRGAAVAALVLAILRPALLAREGRLAKPRLLILLDAGHAMKGKAPGAASRLAQAAAWLKKHRAEIEDRADATVTLVSDRARPLGGLDKLDAAAAEGTAFKPDQSLPDALPAEGPPARTWLITDGIAEGGGDLGRLLAGLGSPVDLLGAGPSKRETGAAFLDLKAPDFAFLHGAIPVEATVEATGLAGREVVVTLSRADEGAPGGWRETERLKRRVGADLETFPVSLSARADALGTARLRLTAAGGGRERAREFRVETVRQKYRIMYLAGRPSPEYSALREFLKADPNHELVSFVILRNPENPSPAPDRELSLIPFPVDEIFGRALPQFDLFILENFSAARFRLPPQYLDALKRFVINGGALLVKGGDNAFSAGGYKNSPLEEVLPVVLSARAPDFVPGLFSPKPGPPEHPLVRLYETPELSQRAWAALPPLDGWGRFASVRAGAAVLASHPGQTTEDGRPLPVAAVRSFGRGKVMMISTDSSWRWKLGAAADPDAAGFYARFWTRAVQYLTGGLDLSKVKFAPLPDRVPPREPARLSLRVFDEGFGPAPAADTRVSVTWTGPDGRPREVAARETEPGAYAVELLGLSPGAHKVRASARVRGRPWGEDEARFSWEPVTDEPMDRAWLTKAAAAGGGRFVDLASVRPGELLDLLPPARPRDETLRRLRPFLSPSWLALAALLFVLEWALRRRSGHA